MTHEAPVPPSEKESFGERLHKALATRGPLCVGIDPHAGLLLRWGLPDSVDGLRTFADTVVAALADRVAVMKPQSAFFERFGAAGVSVLESTIRQARQAGTLVILDAKRGDIGSTVQAYAQAYLSPASPMASDALTVSPYLGFGSLAPVIDEAEAHGAGVFVLALTSNPEGASVQHARTSDGRTVAQMIIDDAAYCNAKAPVLGSVGLVVGATVGDTGHDLSDLNGPILVPGLGAQGGVADDLRALFRDLRGAVVPSYSREILSHGPSRSGLRDAAERALSACQKALF
ncbi:orotidine-5'-phosphate decarboxylase [Luedemannella flava]|uniref:Orotidine 5'-phosphate decarboxylase n=1 Tax=Luedemannella flava TaxID=349316 RepID=A0ABN2MES1_9ACTN